MKFLSEELRYALNLPIPPILSLRQDKGHSLKVPEFFGYESPATRWILAMLTNKVNLKRLIKCGKSHAELFSRYYQVPDRPMDLMPGDYSLETPAYHQQTVLYLTPLALAVYMKELYAVEMLLDLKNEAGRKIIHPAEPCFVQKVFKKGARRVSNELSNTFPILLAIRRNFFEGIHMLLECGFTPQKQLSIIYRMPFKETINLYKDILDYMVELLRHKPCLNVTKIMKILTDPSIGLTMFDLFVYDLELDDNNKWDYVSIFRRVCRTGLGTKYFIEESAIQLINILEQIQMIGYFRGVTYLKVFYTSNPPTSTEKTLSPKTIEELQSEHVSVIMDKIPTIIKASREDLFQLDPNELATRINYDYQVCIGSLFLWYQRCQYNDRCGHYMKLSRLMSKIILDTRIIEDFFVKSDESLALVFSEWCLTIIKPITVSDFRIRMQDYILYTDFLCITFINRYDKIPNVLLNAPILHGRDPAYSPIVRELLQLNKSSFTDVLSNVNTNNQNNFGINPKVFTVVDKENHCSLKFIPANHARHFSLDNYNDSYLLQSNRNTNSCKDSEGHSNSFRSFSKSMKRPQSVIRKTKPIKPKRFVNNSNSLENLQTLSQHDERNFLLTPPGNCQHVSGIKSPNADLYNSIVALATKPKRKSSRSIILSNKKPPYQHHIARTRSSCELLPKPTKPVEILERFPKYSNQNNFETDITDDELKTRLKNLLASNAKYRDVDFDMQKNKVPLKSLRSEISKFKSVENIIRKMQAKISTQLDCLSNNLIASSMIRIMEELSMVNRSKSSNPDFFRVFKKKT